MVREAGFGQNNKVCQGRGSLPDTPVGKDPNSTGEATCRFGVNRFTPAPDPYHPDAHQSLQVSPAIVSLPFKLILFVLVDGWNLLLGSLSQSFY